MAAHDGTERGLVAGLGAAEEIRIAVWGGVRHRSWATKGTENTKADHGKTRDVSKESILRLLRFLWPSGKLDTRVQWQVYVDLAGVKGEGKPGAAAEAVGIAQGDVVHGVFVEDRV